MQKFQQKLANGCICWPTICHLEVVSKIGAKASSWNACTQVSLSFHHCISNGQVPIQALVVHLFLCGIDPVTPEPPMKSIHHVKQWGNPSLSTTIAGHSPMSIAG
jgi:hypothetical protein